MPPDPTTDIEFLDCLCSDVAQLRKYARTAVNRERKGLPADRTLAQLATLQERSEAAVAARRERLPTVSYPPELPISGEMDKIRAAVAEHQVVVLAGETGSGKTTQLPKLCLELGRGTRGMIGHTQPRRLAARTVAARLVEEIGDPAALISHAVRYDDTVTDDTLVKVMTDGILLAELTRDRELSRYDTIIIDEAHERSLNIDFLLGYLRQLLRRRRDLKLIVTSATLDVARFSAHFDDAPVIEVSGRGFPVEVVYAPLDVDGDAEAGAASRADAADTDALLARVSAIYEEIVATEAKGTTATDILMFLPTERDILELARGLRNADLVPAPDVLPLYARLPASEQRRVFHPGSQRRIVLSTNVAETSLTVPRIGYVIDTGLVRISRYSYRSKIQRLPIEPVSQASAEQRKGRCGRIAPGVCFRLYSEEDFAVRPEFTDPEVLRTNLASVVLRMRSLGLGSVEDFPFLDPPDRRAVRDAVRLLEELRALSGSGLSASGRQLARLPVDPRLGQMLLAASRWGALREVLIIVAALAAGDPRERPVEAAKLADERHRQWRDPKSDFMSFVTLWDWVAQARDENNASQFRKLVKKNFLSWLRLREWRELHRQLQSTCADLGLRPSKDAAAAELVHRSLLPGLLSLIGFKGEGFEYLGARGMKFHLFPGSALFQRKPIWVAAAEIVETNRVYARYCTAIDPAWIEEAAEHLLKKQHNEPHWRRKRGQVMIYEKASLYGLPVVERRAVGLAQLDPVLARELFIRHALVEGDVVKAPPFLAHNLELRRSVLALEEKSRQRGFLVEDEFIYGFYDARVPADVLDLRSLERWRRRMEASQPRFLHLTRDLLLARSTDAVTESDFPNEMSFGEVQLPLQYRFAPGERDDGVSMTVPLALLPLLGTDRASWLVPGLLEPKVEALIRGLPKQLRRRLTPLPECLTELMPLLSADARSAESGPLTWALSQRLEELRGVVVPPDAWDESAVPAHLQLNVVVTDESGATLTSSRALKELRAQYEASVEQSDEAVWAQVRADHELPNVDDFPQQRIEERLVLSVAGRRMIVFPCLAEEAAPGGSSTNVALRVLANETDALQAHAGGVTQLLAKRLGKARRQALGQIPGYEQFALRFAPLGDRATLERQLVGACVAAVCTQFEVGPADVRAPDSFREMLEQLRRQLAPMLRTLGPQCDELLQRRSTIVGQMKARQSPAFAGTYADIEAQLTSLLPSQFLARTPIDRVPDLNRYLRGVEYRLEHLQGRVDRDEQLMQEFAPLRARADKLLQRHAAQPDVAPLRWLMEELRVALFAQPVGTQGKVSAKRVRLQLDQLERRWQGS